MGRPPAEFGRRVRQAREARGLSQSQLARDLGYHPSSVNHWEAGRSRPEDPWVMAELARVLEVPIEYLLGALIRQ